MADHEEEINLSGSEPVAAATATIADHEAGNIPELRANVADLSALVKAGETNEQFLDRVLATDKDRFLPWETTSLPSGGLYYDWPDGMCQVRPMGQLAEKILATQRLSASGESLDYLYRECCRFPDGFDPLNLLLGDRIFLLYYLRGITHGNMYEFMVKCPNTDCETTSTHTYDLNDLVHTLRSGNPSLGSEPFRIDLPYMSSAFGRDMWVSVRFLRAHDANDILKRRKAKNKAVTKPGGGVLSKMRQQAVDPRTQQRESMLLDSTLDDNLEKIIVNVLGVEDRIKIRQFISLMHAQDTATIRDWLRKHTPGIDSTVEIQCPECGHIFTMELPITDSFFRPAKR